MPCTSLILAGWLQNAFEKLQNPALQKLVLSNEKSQIGAKLMITSSRWWSKVLASVSIGGFSSFPFLVEGSWRSHGRAHRSTVITPRKSTVEWLQVQIAKFIFKIKVANYLPVLTQLSDVHISAIYEGVESDHQVQWRRGTQRRP